MTKLAFVLGSNWLLSIAELLVYIQDRGFDGTLVDHSRNAAIVDIKQRLDSDQIVDMQSSLGGCYKVGKVIWEHEIDLPLKAYPAKKVASKEDLEEIRKIPWLKIVWPRVKGKKIKFGVSTYPIFDGRFPINFRRYTRGMDDQVKKLLMKNGAKRADYFAYDEPDRRIEGRLNIALWPKTIAKNSLLTPPNAEILAIFSEEKLYIARTRIVYDSMLQQYRDESRPFVSAEISTSPKICRTLLTLAGARPGDTVLDPFCGTGTLLMEAAMLGMKCIGVDIDGDQVQGARSNLKWLAKDMGEKLDYDIVKGDSRELTSVVKKQVDAVAFEPILGPIYKKPPLRDEAEKTIKELTTLYRQVLTEISSILRPDGRVAMTIPVINTEGEPVSVKFRDLTRGTGLALYRMLPGDSIKSRKNIDPRLRIRPSRELIPERKRGQVVQRALIVLEK
ncbi:MAG: tRNA (guanine(10)-N2)-dimethyltransferase [Candidatus Thorarchaeota archaeon AB_25]|nr:MAG: tRNA (guanine(10)-N2)-dimethyltransferase [Candidatus Thorarchaeota archaeon AB_25]